ncbi:D-alanyl-D-alanine carboxypeptidase [Nocardia tenerifensis]|uniref:D-alanyl-D-alanine carboxypeptidase n=1 Tax=Nocardia tenerifensis TaxID=228006 RepID=A0A318KAY3_9NOCA|nr:serine hydrolase domain-containing protein [Nocardia tenerifensis]PXX71027.1 D-alanyl-D-alanine carboxypeptidase [Nocardia tenerifensis]
MRYAVVTVAFALAVALTGCRAAPGVDALQRDVDAIVAVGVTGVQARVVDGAGDRVAVAGKPDIAAAEPVSPNGYFRIGSVTKSLVATVALMLVGEGRLTLDDPARRWLPDLLRDNDDTITVRQLLQHTSGIHDSPLETDTAEGYYRTRYQIRTPEQTVEAAMRQPRDFAPGAGWAYSNAGYVLLGLIIEQVSKRPWHEEVRSRIIEPLGLRDTRWPGESPTLPDPHAKAYQQYAPDGPLTDVTEVVDADASDGYISTTADIGTFYRSLLSGNLLRPAQLDSMRATRPVEGVIGQIWPGIRDGLGLFSVPLSCGGIYWMHNGGQYGYITETGVTEDGRRSVVVSMSTALAGGEDFTRSKGFEQERAATRLVDHALCGE